MARRKNRPKSKKKNEELIVDIMEVGDQTTDFFDKNQNIILGGLFALVLIIGGAFAYKNFYKAPRQKAAVEEMTQAQFQFERDSFALALTNPGGGNLGLLDIIDQYGSTDAGNLANYYAGICYLNLGKFEAAVEYLSDYSPAGEIVPAMKYGALGDAYSELDDMDKALSQYKKAAGASDNEVLVAYYLKKIGLLHEMQGDKAAAKDSFEEIKSRFPNSPDGRDIEKYILRVSS